MRQPILWFLLILSSQAAPAADYAFDNVPLNNFAAAVIKNGFNREVMIHPTIQTKTISLTVSVPDEQAFTTIENALLLHGVQIKDDGSVLYLLPASGANTPFTLNDAAPELRLNPGTTPVTPYWGDMNNENGKNEQSMFDAPKNDYAVVVYKPRYKDVSYLAEVVKFSGGEVLPDRSDASLLIYSVPKDDNERAEKINNALEQVDQPENSVHLHVVFIEITETDSKGFSLTGLLKTLSNRFSVDLGVSSLAGINFAIKGSSVDSVLTLLDEMVDYRYLAEPALSVVHGKEARLVVGSDVPLRGSIGRDSSGVTLQSVSYKTTGLQMTVRPLIYENYVMVQGQFEVSSIATNATSDIDSPLVLRRSISTHFSIKDDEVVILGGLDDRKDSRSSSGFLGLPIGTRKEATGTRIIVLAEMRRGMPSADSGQDKTLRGAGGARERASASRLPL